MIVAYVFSSSGENYYKTLYLFLIISCLAIINSVYLIYLDHHNNNVINTNVFVEEESESNSLVINEEKQIKEDYGTIVTSASSNGKAV